MKRITSILCISLLLFSCVDQRSTEELKALQTQLDSLKTATATIASKGQITSFLTFQENNAEEAMNFYVGLFENSKITDIQRHPAGGPAKEGTIFFARFELNGSQFACSDSYIKHEWDFSPGISNWVDCSSAEELEKLFAELSEGGQVMMPIGNYGFSQKFSWVEDRFGISWQLNLE